VGKERNASKYLARKYKKDSVKELSEDGRMTLKRVLNKYDGRAWTGLYWINTRTSGGLF
jgi:hypothetical protein